VRAFLVGLPAPAVLGGHHTARPTIVNLVKGGASAFLDAQGEPHRFTHKATDPPIQFSYDADSCAVTSTGDPRLAGGNLEGVYIVYSPYGLWNLEVRGREGLDLAAVTAIRFEFHLHYKASSNFGSDDIFFAGAPAPNTSTLFRCSRPGVGSRRQSSRHTRPRNLGG
jgi:hypothetical protein